MPGWNTSTAQIGQPDTVIVALGEMAPLTLFFPASQNYVNSRGGGVDSAPQLRYALLSIYFKLGHCL